MYMAAASFFNYSLFAINAYFLTASFLLSTVYYIYLLKLNNSFQQKAYLIIKNLVLLVFIVSFCLYTLFICEHFSTFYSPFTMFFSNLAFPENNWTFFDNASVIVIYLCYFVGLISIFTLGDRFWKNNNGLPLLFLYFPLIIIFLTTADSFLVTFFYYELLLLPSVYFVYKAGYTRKSHQANVYFLVWTQLGSLLSLLGVCYLLGVVGNSDFSYLYDFTFSKSEKYWLYLIFFFGFGFKVPIWPFHYWLTKVHVEAPSGFSIFLSGFLVKSAVYCFYRYTLILNLGELPIICIVVVLLGVIDASLKMWGQVDIKKLIAYATVQEMNVIYFFFVLGDGWSIKAGLIFLFAHGILSSFMFYLIECIYKRTQSRNMYKIVGLSVLYPSLGLAVWLMLILFFGFPGTIKFFAEFYFLAVLTEFNIVLAFFIGFVMIFLGSVGFVRCWFSVIYGHPGYPKAKSDLTREEVYLILFMVFMSFAPCFLVYFL